MERLTFARRGWPPRLREDGAALAGDGGEEQVEHVLEQVGQRPVGEQRPRGLAEDLQHPVLPLQLLGIDGGLRLDVAQLPGGEDAGAFRRL